MVIQSRAIDELPPSAWGQRETSVGRYGRIRLRVIVLPPDMSRTEWFRWRAYQSWPFFGFVAGALVFIGAALMLPVSAAVGAALVTWLVPLMFLRAAVAPTITRTHDQWACHDASDDDAAEDQRFARVSAVAHRMLEVESAFRDHAIGEDEFRRGWLAAYTATEEVDEENSRPAAGC